MQTYDLIIVGGGLVGAGLALALRDSGMRIALIDARTPTLDDPRLFGLNIGSCNFLKHLNVWNELSSHAFAIHEVHISSKGHFGCLRLAKEDIHLADLGHVVPAKWIELALNKKLQSQNHCVLYQPARVLSLTSNEIESTLKIIDENGEQFLSAKMIIGADGTTSTIREQMNIATDVHDYQQTAIVTRLKLNRPQKHVAHERFVSKGAIALLPLTNEECACIWSTDTNHAELLMSLTESEYVKAMQAAFGSRAGQFIEISKRHSFPLRMVTAETGVKENVYLLGNAAHTLHPIAAQGFNLAVYEVSMLVDAILNKRKQDGAFTAQDLRLLYETTKRQQAISMKVSHGLSRGLLGDAFFQSLMLPIGMTGLNLLTPIKKRFIQHMLGRSQHVPRMLLSEMM